MLQKKITDHYIETLYEFDIYKVNEVEIHPNGDYLAIYEPYFLSDLYIRSTIFETHLRKLTESHIVSSIQDIGGSKNNRSASPKLKRKNNNNENNIRDDVSNLNKNYYDVKPFNFDILKKLKVCNEQVELDSNQNSINIKDLDFKPENLEYRKIINEENQTKNLMSHCELNEQCKFFK